MNTILGTLANALTMRQDLEQQVRQILELLEITTGLETTYLTVIDLTNQEQTVIYSRNGEEPLIPEGLTVPWHDTLCKRALDENCPYTADVPGRWGDSAAATELGIVTYLSQPVRIGEGMLYGTLCGASRTAKAMDSQAQALLAMCAKIIAREIEHLALVRELRKQNLEYAQFALIDPLTGLLNRRALLRELARLLATAQRAEMTVHVAFIDLDQFKQINDQYGHDIGDRMLMEIAFRLQSGLRESDLIARYGGDEFVVVGSERNPNGEHAIEKLGQRIEQVTRGIFNLGSVELNYAGPSVGVVTAQKDESDAEALIKRADQLMYTVKESRRAARGDEKIRDSAMR